MNHFGNSEQTKAFYELIRDNKLEHLIKKEALRELMLDYYFGDFWRTREELFNLEDFV